MQSNDSTKFKKQMLSTTKKEKCPHCASENIVKDGFTKGRNQGVWSKDGGKSRVLQK